MDQLHGIDDARREAELEVWRLIDAAAERIQKDIAANSAYSAQMNALANLLEVAKGIQFAEVEYPLVHRHAG